VPRVGEGAGRYRADVSILRCGNQPAMETILWLIAVVLVIWGIITLVRGSVLTGIILIIVGLLVGPGGVSIFT
jgi:hypothetical protein